MMATKEQERTALKKIQKIIDGLGEDSYIGTALEGCLEVAEENIEYDAAFSMQDRLESARQEADEAKAEIEKCRAEIERLKKKVESLSEQLEREQEWKPYVDKDNVSQKDYENVANEEGVKHLTDDEAKKLLYDWFGFAPEKTKIVKSIPIYEVNRHRMLRQVGSAERLPVYNATDWNYICFNCGGMAYELYNDNLRFRVW